MKSENKMPHKVVIIIMPQFVSLCPDKKKIGVDVHVQQPNWYSAPK